MATGEPASTPGPDPWALDADEIYRAATRPLEHVWTTICGARVCKRCGLCARADGEDKPCRGNLS